MSRLAVVCGGSRGIGKAVSRLLAERDCRLVVVSRNKDAAQAAVASLHGGIQTVQTLLILTKQAALKFSYLRNIISPSELTNLAHTGANTK